EEEGRREAQECRGLGRCIRDRRNNVYRVESKDKKPARFIFDLEQK
ncbi:hypothetical protein ACISJZ_09455, partial [Campylobacter coli]